MAGVPGKSGVDGQKASTDFQKMENVLSRILNTFFDMFRVKLAELDLLAAKEIQEIR